MRNHALEAVRSYYQKILPFYDVENEDRHDLGFWRDLCEERKPHSILELGAGSGRVTVILANAAPVVALDLSLDMLRRAASRLAGNSNANLLAADMRRFALACRFDLIVAPNDPFSHLTRGRERQVALRLVARHLAPGGTLVIDGLHRPERKRIETPEREEHGVSIRETWTPLGAGNRWRARFGYRRGEERVEAEFVARSWDPAEADRMFHSAGLELKDTWGDFDRSPFTAKAPHIILVADKSPASHPIARTA